MSFLSPSSGQSAFESKFTQIIKDHLEGLIEASLVQIGKKLFPIMSSNNIYSSLYNCLHTFYTIRINKGQKFSDGTNIILKYAYDMKDTTLYPKIKELVQNKQFTAGLEQIIQKELFDRKSASDRFRPISNNINMNNPHNNQHNNLHNNNNNTNNFNNNRQQISNSANQNNIPTNNVITVRKITKPSINNVVDISDDSPPEQSNQVTLKITIPSSNLASNTSNSTFNHQTTHNPLHNMSPLNNNNNTDPYEAPNLADRNVCLCGKSCNMMQPQKDHVFKCYHCNLYYHIECMQRGKNQISQRDPVKRLAACSYCHLKHYCPLKEVSRTLFVGVLKQGRKRHGVTFNLDMLELKTKKVRVQVRSFRLKQKIQTFTLFPDSASFSINNRFQKEFLPLPKQSSLKYRKDEPFLLTQNLINHENKLTIIERIPKKESKDDRIEPENHLLGIYLVEDKVVPQVSKQVKMQQVFGFYQSKALLDRCFKIGDSQDITCEVVKIPVICTLTIERIKIPVRGIFCSHYQCFDLSNFLMLTSSSVNPRWLCPLCKLPAYKFKYDTIIGSIIDEYSKQQLTEIMFSKDGEFKVYSNDEVCAGSISNIKDLPIDISYKRPISEVYRQTEDIVNEEAIKKDIQNSNINQIISDNKSEKNTEVNRDSLLDQEEERKFIETEEPSNGDHKQNIISNASTIPNPITNMIQNNQILIQKNFNKQNKQNKIFQIPANADIISLDD